MNFKSGQTFGNWTLNKRLGRGGNGEVWKAHSPDGSLVAIKLLYKRTSDKAKSRFHREVNVMQSLSDLHEVISVLDANTTDDWPWCAMPIGEPILNYVRWRTFEDIISLFIKLAIGLHHIHNAGYTHRDIKPANILIVDEQPVYTDFGLAHEPNNESKQRLTRRKETIGSYSTIAPEMRIAGSSTKFERADVFSLAKTLWIVLTGKVNGFEGQYGNEAKNILIERHYKVLIEPIHKLLTSATSHKPENRPTASDFREALEQWRESSEDIDANLERHWIDAQSYIVGCATPDHAEWTNINDILEVLNQLAAWEPTFHVHLPTGGGLDLGRARAKAEEGLIEIDLGGISTQLLPERLAFEGFPSNELWNFLVLQCSDTPAPAGAPITLSDDPNGIYGELRPGVFIDPKHMEWDDWEGRPLPKSARYVKRPQGGNYLIVGRSSFWNKASETYDGRHNDLSVSQLRTIIEHLIKKFERRSDTTISGDDAESTRPQFAFEPTPLDASVLKRPALSSTSASKIKDLIETCKSFRNRIEYLDSEFPGTSRVFDPEYRKRYRTLRAPVYKAFEDLTKGQKVEVLALTWLGRDILHQSDFYLTENIWKKYLSEAQRPLRDFSGYLVEKTELHKYLRRALALFE